MQLACATDGDAARLGVDDVHEAAVSRAHRTERRGKLGAVAVPTLNLWVNEVGVKVFPL